MRSDGMETASQLAAALGYERSERVRKILNGESKPSFEMLEDLARRFASVDLHWLITGKRMAAQKPSDDSVSKEDFEALVARVNELAQKGVARMKRKTG